MLFTVIAQASIDGLETAAKTWPYGAGFLGGIGGIVFFWKQAGKEWWAAMGTARRERHDQREAAKQAEFNRQQESARAKHERELAAIKAEAEARLVERRLDESIAQSTERTAVSLSTGIAEVKALMSTMRELMLMSKAIYERLHRNEQTRQSEPAIKPDSGSPQ